MHEVSLIISKDLLMFLVIRMHTACHSIEETPPQFLRCIGAFEQEEVRELPEIAQLVRVSMEDLAHALIEHFVSDAKHVGQSQPTSHAEHFH